MRISHDGTSWQPFTDSPFARWASDQPTIEPLAEADVSAADVSEADDTASDATADPAAEESSVVIAAVSAVMPPVADDADSGVIAGIEPEPDSDVIAGIEPEPDSDVIAGIEPEPDSDVIDGVAPESDSEVIDSVAPEPEVDVDDPANAAAHDVDQPELKTTRPLTLRRQRRDSPPPTSLVHRVSQLAALVQMRLALSVIALHRMALAVIQQQQLLLARCSPSPVIQRLCLFASHLLLIVLGVVIAALSELPLIATMSGVVVALLALATAWVSLTAQHERELLALGLLAPPLTPDARRSATARIALGMIGSGAATQLTAASSLWLALANSVYGLRASAIPATPVLQQLGTWLMALPACATATLGLGSAPWSLAPIVMLLGTTWVLIASALTVQRSLLRRAAIDALDDPPCTPVALRIVTQLEPPPLAAIIERMIQPGASHEAALAALVAIDGTAAVSHLLHQLDAVTDVNPQRTLIAAIVHLGTLADDATPPPVALELARRLHSTALQPVRHELLHAIDRIGDRAATGALIALLANPDNVEHHDLAARVLLGLDDPEALDSWLDWLGDTSRSLALRCHAAAAIGRLGDASVFELLQAIQHEALDPRLADWVAWAIERIETPELRGTVSEVLATLERSLDDDPPSQ
jgi:HEAT repeat protein